MLTNASSNSYYTTFLKSHYYTILLTSGSTSSRVTSNIREPLFELLTDYIYGSVCIALSFGSFGA